MTFTRANLLAVPLLALLLPGTAPARGDDLQDVMELSGIVEQVGLSADQLGERLTEQLTTLPVPDAVRGSVEQAVASALAADDMLAGITRRVAASVEPEDLAKLRDWYESDVGRRITAAEILATGPDAGQQISARVDSLLSDSDRLEVARTINEIHDGTEDALRFMEMVQTALMIVVMDVTGSAGAYDLDGIRRTMRDGMEEARPMVERLMVATYVYTYKDLPDSDLEAYLEFLDRPETRRFNAAVSDALAAEWQRAFDAMAKSMTGALTAARSGTGSA